MTHNSSAEFDNAPIAPPVLNGQRIEDWKTRWRRLTSAGVNIDREHYVIGKSVAGGQWIGIVK